MTEGRAATKPTKQAVVLIHGMGEQFPMQTLRSFVETIWQRDRGIDARRKGDPEGDGNPVWWKPDARAGSPELSRITTRAGHPAGMPNARVPRVDFYELYWADLTEGNTLAQFRDWFWFLLCRRPGAVPKAVRPIWLALWTLTAAFGFLLAWKGSSKAFLFVPAPDGWINSILAITAIVYPSLLAFALAYFGDVPRYTRAAPTNIAARRAIRERGLALLRAIDGSGQYARIVIVGHSLGSILAYDLVKLLWSEREAARTMRNDDPIHETFRSFENAVERLGSRHEDALDAYRVAQAKIFELIREGRDGQPGWPISDLVTLGSPLTHAEFLLERDAPALSRGIAERRFPTSPPFETEMDELLYRPAPGVLRAHHAASFSAVRWTNIYDAPKAIVFGDCISGPVSRIFGRGIRDVRVTIRRPWLGRLFTHTRYWTDADPTARHLEALRDAIHLDGGRTIPDAAA